MAVVMGLDFGTTNSALAIRDPDGARVVRINNRVSGESTLRSALFIDEEGEVSVGQQAIADYIAHEGSYGRFLQSLKAFLPSATFSETRIFGRKFTIEDLIAEVLSEIKRVGETYAGSHVDKVVLGRPVFFSDVPELDKLAENRLRAAAEAVGFKEIDFEYEPIAATLAYQEQLKPGTEQVVLMGDFGGGTSDFTVMKLRAGAELSQKEKRDRVLSVGGVYVGGDTFDGRIMWKWVTPYFGRDVRYKSLTGQVLEMPVHIVRRICEWHQIPFLREPKILQIIKEVRRTADKPNLMDNLESLILENKGFRLFQAIEQAKKQLSAELEADIRYRDRGMHFNERVTRPDFQTAIANDLNNITNCINKTIADAGIKPEDIDKILLTGGSSFVPAVQNLFATKFGNDKIIHLDAFTSVAHGLALSR